MKKYLFFLCGLFVALFLIFDSASAAMIRTTFQGEVPVETGSTHPYAAGTIVSLSWVWDDASTEFTAYPASGGSFTIALSNPWTSASDAEPSLSLLQIPVNHQWSFARLNANAIAIGDGITHQFEWLNLAGENHLYISAFISLIDSVIVPTFDIRSSDWSIQWFDNTTVIHEENSAVPVPASIVLFGLGLLGIAGINRKNQA